MRNGIRFLTARSVGGDSHEDLRGYALIWEGFEERDEKMTVVMKTINQNYPAQSKKMSPPIQQPLKRFQLY